MGQTDEKARLRATPRADISLGGQSLDMGSAGFFPRGLGGKTEELYLAELFEAGRRKKRAG